jgi:hypothetical protein
MPDDGDDENYDRTTALTRGGKRTRRSGLDVYFLRVRRAWLKNHNYFSLFESSTAHYFLPER